MAGPPPAPAAGPGRTRGQGRQPPWPRCPPPAANGRDDGGIGRRIQQCTAWEASGQRIVRPAGQRRLLPRQHNTVMPSPSAHLHRAQQCAERAAAGLRHGCHPQERGSQHEPQRPVRAAAQAIACSRRGEAGWRFESREGPQGQWWLGVARQQVCARELSSHTPQGSLLPGGAWRACLQHSKVATRLQCTTLGHAPQMATSSSSCSGTCPASHSRGHSPKGRSGHSAPPPTGSGGRSRASSAARAPASSRARLAVRE